MSKTDDGREPIDVLYDIEEKVSHLATANGKLPKEIRFCPEVGSVAHEALSYIDEVGTVTSSDVEQEISGNATGVLAELYHGYLIDRRGNGTAKRPYRYEINELGRVALSNGDEQQELTDTITHASQPDPEPNPNPWEEHDISETEYHALTAIRDSCPNPKSTEANEKFLERADVSTNNKGAVITRYLTDLYREGYIDRTPNQPYHYWLTDEGKEVLDTA